MSQNCNICAALADSPRHVFDDGPWFAFAAADVPGWVMLGTKKHVEGMWSLSAEDAAGLGPAIRSIGRAVKRAANAERVHLVFLGEHQLHFHLGFFPRTDGEPSLFDNARLVAAAATDADAGRAGELASRIRSELASELSRP